MSIHVIHIDALSINGYKKGCEIDKDYVTNTIYQYYRNNQIYNTKLKQPSRPLLVFSDSMYELTQRLKADTVDCKTSQLIILFTKRTELHKDAVNILAKYNPKVHLFYKRQSDNVDQFYTASLSSNFELTIDVNINSIGLDSHYAPFSMHSRYLKVFAHRATVNEYDTPEPYNPNKVKPKVIGKISLDDGKPLGYGVDIHNIEYEQHKRKLILLLVLQ